MKNDVSRLAVRKFICDNFVVEDGNFDDDDSLLAENIVDSTGILELVSFLEENFNIQVADEEILPSNFDSVIKICSFVDKKAAESDDSPQA